MKTLNLQKSEELWNEIKNIEYLVSKLSGCVQNPDFVNEEIAQENYEMFIDDYRKVTSKLVKLREDIFLLHNEIIGDLNGILS